MLNLNIDEQLNKSINDKEYELEFIYGNESKLDKTIFLKLLEYCKSNYEFMDDNNTLDIRVKIDNKVSDERITISNLYDIKKYCKNDILENNVEYIEKKNERDFNYVSNDYNFKINLKREIELTDDSDKIIKIIENWESVLKQFRYKKRYSFLLPNKLFRVDLTIVKSSKYNKALKSYMLYQSFKTANILNESETYEFEIEFVGNTIDDDNKYLETYRSKGKNNNYQKLSPKLNYIDTKIKNTDVESIVGEYVIISDEFLKKKRMKGKLSGKKTGYVEKIIIEDDLTYADIRFPDIDNLLVPINDIHNENFTIDNVISEKIDKSIINKIKLEFEEYILNFLTIINNTKLFVGKTKTNEILQGYYELTKQTKKKVFMGPQPVTLTFDSLDKNNFGSIIYDYAVTEKADGLRHLLYIGEDKIGYLINSRMDKIVNTGIKFPVKGEWLLDGEYIQKNKNDEDIRLFMIFDVYWAENTPRQAHKYPFIGEGLNRLEILNKFKDYVKDLKIVEEDLQTFRIDFKVYEFGISRQSDNKDNSLLQKSIFIKSKNILDRSKKGGYEYDIDGLIYLPVNIPVKAKSDMKALDFINGTWNYNYKWKPPEENTIDFKIKLEKEMTQRADKRIYKDLIYPYTTNENDDKVIKYYKKVKLYVSYDESRDDSIQFCMKMIMNQNKYSKKEIIFDPEYKIDVSTTNIPLVNGRMMCGKDNREIKDGDIVELRYNEDAKNGMIWEPLKIRDDKISAQFFLIANNVWDTIINPITTNMISGHYDESDFKINDKVSNNLYYVDDVDTESRPLRKFHNYIKSQLITGVCSLKSVSIMDTSIGRGGDLNKYIQKDIKCKFLFGLDISSVNEACKRYTYLNVVDKPNTLFIRYDTSKNITEKTGLIGTDEEIEFSSNIINILYGEKQSIPKEFKQLRQTMNRFALDKFDVISSQFTIHYYFKDQLSFKGYLSNLIDNCKSGGYFIGTCYDGKRIFDALKDKDRIEYMNEDGNLIYSIEKKYETENFDDVTFGERIDVYMDSIGDTYSEYLVNFDMFVSIMSDNGFELVKPKMKPEYDIFDGPMNSFESILKNLTKYKDTSNFKYYKDSLGILKDKMLYDLSSYNNYFIFQKK